MKALTAKRAVLYQGRMYEPGDALPAGDSKMVEAWLQAESAEWTGEAQEPVQEDQEGQEAAEGTQEAQEDQGTAEGTQEDQGAAEGAQEDQGAAEDTLDVVDGHLTRESLETMAKANLEKLAKDMGVEIPRGATKALIIERLAAVTVEAPAPDGGAQ